MPKRFNCSMFSKISPVAKYLIASVYLYKHYVLYKKYVLYKNMLIFRDFSIHNLIKIYFKTHQTAQYFQNFLRGASICPELPSICVQL